MCPQNPSHFLKFLGGQINNLSWTPEHYISDEMSSTESSLPAMNQEDSPANQHPQRILSMPHREHIEGGFLYGLSAAQLQTGRLLREWGGQKRKLQRLLLLLLRTCGAGTACCMWLKVSEIVHIYFRISPWCCSMKCRIASRCNISIPQTKRLLYCKSL